MTAYNVYYNELTTRIQLIPDGGTAPTDYSFIGSFDHETDDSLGYPENHVLFHHFRDLLYNVGVTNLQAIEVDDHVQASLPASLALTVYQANEDLAVGSTVAKIIVNNPKGSYVFVKLDDPDNIFDIIGDDLKLLNPLNFEEATSHTVKIAAFFDGIQEIDKRFTITVNNVIEGLLGPSEIVRKVSDPAGMQVAMVTGLDGGAGEILTALLPADNRLALFGDRIIIGSVHTNVGNRTITVYTSQGRTLEITDQVTGLAPMPILTPVEGSSNNSDTANTVILELPDMSQDEVRTYIPTTGPAFTIGPSGNLLRGSQIYEQGVYTGVITQYNGEEFIETPVTINATDLPMVIITSPPAETAVNPPVVDGFIYWVNHDLGGLKIIIKVDDVEVTTQTTPVEGTFHYVLEHPIAPSTLTTINVAVQILGNTSNEVSIEVFSEDTATTNWANAVIARGYTPSSTLREQVNTLIQAIKAGGSWAKRDRIQIYCWPDELCGVELKTSTALIPQGGLTFTADRGYTGDGSTGWMSVLPYSDTNQVQQDSVNLACFSLTAGSNTNYHVGNSNGSLKVRARTVNNSGGSANSTTLLSAPSFAASAPVDIAIQRSLANQQRLYVNGSSLVTDTVTSSAVNNSSVTAFRNSGSFANCQIAAIRIGGALTNAEMYAEYNAIRTFLQARGAIS